MMKKKSSNKKAGLKTFLILAAGLVLLFAAMVASLALGSVQYSMQTLQNALMTGTETQEGQIIWDIRMPRMLTALLVGCFLAISGAFMQTLTRNALAEPGLLGISSGAAFVLVIGLALFPGMSAAGSTAAAMIGASITMVLILALANWTKGGSSPVKLALAGMAIGMFLTSLTTAISLYYDVAKNMSFWYAGALYTAAWGDVKLLSLFGLAAIPVLLYLLRPMTTIRFGVDVARSLGVRVKLVQFFAVVTILLLTGSSVAVAGSISFVGLIIPHISRMLVGEDYFHMIPVSMVLGGLLLVLADLGSKFMNPPFETSVGIVTALIGVPFFLYLIKRRGVGIK
ncbi:iron ABC transporter permease [Jeotgalibacillus sp. ET6]|uniref:FecCD family ABC transporter permease n=1 Tax=Jeotgalibacillus sp. ET6 TaxID=3037260 RepID=UPI0024182FC5|nr:iron ABC transporter permease [Jeotgalibacillus sp. ET6]MDG5471933.1 iron ABC transporter permease [Jeotgalibacillus sp. ET6]